MGIPNSGPKKDDHHKHDKINRQHTAFGRGLLGRTRRFRARGRSSLLGCLGLGGFLCSRLLFRRFFFWLYLRSEEHTSELQSRGHLVCRLLLEKKKAVAV